MRPSALTWAFLSKAARVSSSGYWFFQLYPDEVVYWR